MTVIDLYLYMDFFVKRIWYITVPTAMAVLIFQLYWLHNTYVNQQTDFKQLATNALEKAYEEAIIESVLGSTPKSKSAQMHSNSIRLYTKVDSKILKGNEPGKLMMVSKGTAKDTTIKIENADADLSRFLSHAMSMTSFLKIDLSILTKCYKNELKNKGIEIPFKLEVNNQIKNTAFALKPTLIRIQTPDKKGSVTASFDGLNKSLILKIIWPILLSFLLVMLITGCIWVLWRIIHQQKKLEIMKNDFISNISHELKTPLSILNTTNEVLLNFDGMRDLKKTERYLKLSKNELQKLQSLIDGILALTKMEHADNLLGPFEKVNIEDLLEVVTASFNELPGVYIICDVNVDVKLIQTWPEALKTMLSNLIDNAIKYTPTPDKLIKVAVTEDTKYYQLSVTDQGIGIAQHQQAFIFDKFYRVPHGDIHEVKGYGLGLSHVKSLLQKMDANISVSSKLAEGSIFTIKLKKHG